MLSCFSLCLLRVLDFDHLYIIIHYCSTPCLCCFQSRLSYLLVNFCYKVIRLETKSCRISLGKLTAKYDRT